MSMPAYRNLHGTVFFGKEGEFRHVCDEGQMLGLVFDEENGTIHKHGAVDRVRTWLDATQAKLRANGAFGEMMANNLQIASFPACDATIKVLNEQVIDHTPAVPSLLEALAEASVEVPISKVAPGY